MFAPNTEWNDVFTQPGSRTAIAAALEIARFAGKSEIFTGICYVCANKYVRE
jgi:hypothetical protein